jgi:cytochrome c biogenesis protein CcdA
MLGSITPLGERGRGSRWRLTVSAYIVGSVIGGLFAGALTGLAGALVVHRLTVGDRLTILVVGIVLGLMLDLRVFGLRLPTLRRQVDDEWRARYRGWVWGVGFGLQLGVGAVTIVTTSMVYAVWLASALSGSVRSGALIGVAFGLARALPVFTVSKVQRPEQLVRVDATLTRLAAPARRAGYVAATCVAAVGVIGAVRW